MKTLFIMLAAFAVLTSCGVNNRGTDMTDMHETHTAETRAKKSSGNIRGEKMIKNINHGTVLSFAGQVEYLPGQVVSKTLAQNRHHSLTLFAFDKGEEISAHDSSGDALVIALDGTGKITIDGREYLLNAGESIVMPANIPHAVYAEERFKMFLVVSFPES